MTARETQEFNNVNFDARFENGWSREVKVKIPKLEQVPKYWCLRGKKG